MPLVITWGIALVAGFGALALHMQTFDGGSWRWHLHGAGLLTITLVVAVLLVSAIEDWASNDARREWKQRGSR